MHRVTKRRIPTIILLLIFSTTHTTKTAGNNTPFSQYPILCCIVGTAVALIIAKFSYNYYQTYTVTPKQTIENCRLTYKKISQEVQEYHIFYQSDVKVSDWELKEIILDSNKTSYPFIAYYTALIKTSWILHKHHEALTKQLREISKHVQRLANNKSENTDHQKETLLHLTDEGISLQEYTVKTIRLIKILKNKVKLFQEYTADCHNWSQAIRNK